MKTDKVMMVGGKRMNRRHWRRIRTARDRGWDDYSNSQDVNPYTRTDYRRAWEDGWVTHALWDGVCNPAYDDDDDDLYDDLYEDYYDGRRYRDDLGEWAT